MLKGNVEETIIIIKSREGEVLAIAIHYALYIYTFSPPMINRDIQSDIHIILLFHLIT